LYQKAAQLEVNFERVECCDEKTGIQALEQAVAKKAARVGQIERIEHNYIRHGTICLIANMAVATGKITTTSLLEQRKEADFALHIEQSAASDPKVRKWHFVVDQLNTHQSESLVRFVVARDGLSLDLGEKGKSGILGSKASRKAFLSDSSHSVVFHYTPKHSSWMNQIEVWFSILVRKYLKRSSFESKEALKKGISQFVTYFNQTMGRAFRWKFRGFQTSGD
jgi:transposase